MKESKKELLPASALRKFESVEKAEISTLEALQKDIKELAQKIDRSVEVNVNLQTRIVDLMTKLTEIIESLKDVIAILKGPVKLENVPTIEEQKEAMAVSMEPKEVEEEQKPTDLTLELKELLEQNKLLISTLKDLEADLKRSETKEAIKKALEKLK